MISILQMQFIGRTSASQAEEAGSIPVICFFICPILYFSCIFSTFQYLQAFLPINIYVFCTLFLFFFTHMMTATIIIGIILMIPIHAGPRIAILEYCGFTKYAKIVNAFLQIWIYDTSPTNLFSQSHKHIEKWSICNRLNGSNQYIHWNC